MSNTKHVKAKFCLLLALSSPLITLSLRIFPSFDKTLYPATPQNTSFSICDNQFFMGTSPIQIISGSIHYFRIHPDLWQDRLERAVAMGLNAIEVYVPWNVHEPYPGQFVFDAGFSDLERFLRLADSLHFIVLLRPGPYICAEWDFGGFPWWLGASAVSGGGTMNLRSLDADYMRHVERWWSHLFPRIKPLLHSQGGPVVMVQIENEYGFCGDDAEYIRQLLRVAKHHLGDDGVVYYTTDPPSVIDKGTLKGGEIYSAVDFGPDWFSLDDAFGKQASFNVQGRSPPLCTEFYSGWLTHWGESMANTSTSTLADYTRQILEFRNNTGSLSFYMIHGGTNFGFWAGANVDGMHYMPHITSYDYDAPISEAGDYGQPGIGGENKYFVLRKVIQDHMAKVGGRFFLPPVPPKPSIQGYGAITFNQSIPLLDVIQDVGMYSDVPHTMEEYGQMWGLILYRVLCSIDPSQSEHVLDVGSPPHDMAQIFVDGTFVGTIDRNERTTCVLPALNNTMVMQLDILVEAHGRQNGGCGLEGFDLKGLQSDNVTLNGKSVCASYSIFFCIKRN